MGKQHSKQQKVRHVVTVVDPKKAKEEREKAEEERIRGRESLYKRQVCLTHLACLIRLGCEQDSIGISVTLPALRASLGSRLSQHLLHQLTSTYVVMMNLDQTCYAVCSLPDIRARAPWGCDPGR